MTQLNATTFNIQRLTGVCAVTGRTLEPGEAYMAVLVEFDPTAEAPADDAAAAKADETADTKDASAQAAPTVPGDPGFRRLDVSMEAWNNNQRPERMFSYWKATVPEPTEKKKLFVDDDVLMNLFRRLGDDEHTDRAAFRFVIGLILMRKRLLKYEGNERVSAEGPDAQPQEWWLLKARGEEEPMRVLDPRLDEAQIQQVTEQLSEVLDAEF